MQDKPITIPWTSVSSTRFSHAQIQTGRDPKLEKVTKYTIDVIENDSCAQPHSSLGSVGMYSVNEHDVPPNASETPL
jgi:hypothetical protein